MKMTTFNIETYFNHQADDIAAWRKTNIVLTRLVFRGKYYSESIYLNAERWTRWITGE